MVNSIPLRAVPDRPLRLLVEVGDGRAASAILDNGFLEYCLEMGASIHVISPGTRHAPFVERYQLPGVEFSYLSVDAATRLRHPRLFWYELGLGKWLCARGLGGARRMMWRIVGELTAKADSKGWLDTIREIQPDCMLSTNLKLGFARGLMAACHRVGIPTVGNVFSWDHPYYHIGYRPDKLTCWSQMIADTLEERSGFKQEQIEIVGAPAFDPYSDPNAVWSRGELCDRLGLDASRPILLYATLGQLRQHWDETGTFRALISALDEMRLQAQPQVVLRLHPLSVDYYFEEFRSHPDVVFSRYLGYCPAMRWWPSRDEVVLAGNLLRHADVCISPGSTMAVEAAIFDTPTIVPTFNPVTPEEFEEYFRSAWLQKHFRFLVEMGQVPFPRTIDEMIEAIRTALEDRASFSEGTRAIREYVLGPLDGRATERLAEATISLARRGAPRCRTPKNGV